MKKTKVSGIRKRPYRNLATSAHDLKHPSLSNLRPFQSQDDQARKTYVLHQVGFEPQLRLVQELAPFPPRSNVRISNRRSAQCLACVSQRPLGSFRRLLHEEQSFSSVSRRFNISINLLPESDFSTEPLVLDFPMPKTLGETTPSRRTKASRASSLSRKQDRHKPSGESVGKSLAL